jgi:hypothetical protein
MLICFDIIENKYTVTDDKCERFFACANTLQEADEILHSIELLQSLSFLRA